MNATDIARVQQNAPLPCSQSQKRVLFESHLHPDNSGLNVAVRWLLDGNVVHQHIEKAWEYIVQRHQTLRTSFAIIDGEPAQIVEPNVPFRVPLIDLTTLSDNVAAEEAERIASLEARSIFDISIAPLLRVKHLRVSRSRSIILVTAHHTVCDGWSIGILAREMGELCAQLSAGRAPSLAPLAFTYADYVEQERGERDASGDATADIPLDVQTGLRALEPFEIVPDFPRPPIQTANGEIISHLIERETTDALAIAARGGGATLFMAAYAALLVVLHRTSGCSDITLSTQIAGRDDVNFEPLVGPFINTIPLSADLSHDPSFRQLLDLARDLVSDAFEMRHVPLEDIVKLVNPKRDLSRNAIFSVNFVYQRSFIENASYGSFTVTDLPSRSAGPICDLNFFMVERPDGWRASCEFNTDLYRRETVDGMLRRFVRLIRTLPEHPDLPVSRVPLMDDAEREHVVSLSTGPMTPYGRDETVQAVFARSVAMDPEAIAVVGEGGALTYAQLDGRSNQLALELQHAGVVVGSVVGVALERSPQVPLVLLAILKLGATYVPLDPSYPPERLAFIVHDASVELLVVERATRDRFSAIGTGMLDLDEAAQAIAGRLSQGFSAAVDAGARAYIMYTSGSTGKPKGVAVPHRAIVRLVRETNYVNIATDDTVLHHAPLAFDASTFEIWAPLLNGARLAIAPRGALSLADLDTTLSRNAVTTLWLTAALFREAVEARLVALSRLRRLLAGGDVISPSHAIRFLNTYPTCQLINGYGPTENTTFSCCYLVRAAGDLAARVPIGTPIANSTAYALDRHMQLVPANVVGQLFVGGDGLSAGYVGLPELTAERFVEDPFSRVPRARLYRTGDLVRRREDGILEFLGRIDGQVKIRGFRIELREIEMVLSRHPSVGNAVAVAHETPAGDKVIAAYVIPLAGHPEQLDIAALRTWLADRLPAFMVPATIVPLAAIPLSANAKIDLRALPALVVETMPVARPPATETEQRLAAMVSGMLAVDMIDREADLFALGFHSMLALRLVAQIRTEFGCDLSLRRLYERPTLAAVAEAIAAPSGPTDPASTGSVVAFNASGARPPFIFFHGDLFADGSYTRTLAAALGPDQPFYAVAPHGTARLPLLNAIEDMAADFVCRLRAVWPQGPYRLGGFCASGLVAYEAARMLRELGEVVDQVVMINASPMPRAKIGLVDALIREIGLNARLNARLRDIFCYNIARAHAALVSGPRGIAAFVRMVVRSAKALQVVDPLEPQQPFEHRKGLVQTKNSFAHVVAALTYHPRPYDGAVTLIWGEDQTTMFDDPTMGWGAVARDFRVVPMSGGHVGSLRGRIDTLADTLGDLLKR